MIRTQERTMEMNLNQSHVHAWQTRQGPGVCHYIDKQLLRILRCTAQAMASSPGGLRFKAGTRPWLDGLPGGRGACAAATRGVNPVLQATAD
ncbi:MAG: hypothetical protein Q7T78_14975 [Rhodoferax sp.]|nr:hypothetical protein [Rhodoferax sp.]